MLELDVRLRLDAFHLAVKTRVPRRVTGVFGPSGAGKTSLLETVAGLRRQAIGRIVFDGEIWLDSEKGVFVPPEERRVGYVPQDGLLFPHLDVLGNLLAGARRRSRRADARDEVVRQVTRLLELDSLLGRPVAALSGGERQRVALGRAVCSRSRLLLLDEPLASLDLPLRRRILPFLRRLREELAMPFLYVSHDPTEVQALCDEILIMQRGSSAAQGPPQDLLADPEFNPLAEERGYDNVLGATARCGDEEGRDLELAPGVRLRVPLFDAPAGARVLVEIPAQQILLGIEPPHGLSAQNCLPAVVKRIRHGHALHFVTATLSGSPERVELVAEVTGRACRELGLEAGRAVHLLIKQTGCRVY